MNEPCTICGCCDQNAYSNCRQCGHPHHDSIEIIGQYPEGWHSWIGIVGNPEIGERFSLHENLYTVVGITAGKVTFDKPLATEILFTQGDRV